LHNSIEKKFTKISKPSIKIDMIKDFIKAINQGPYFICIVCHRCLYKQTVKIFNDRNYPPDIRHILKFVKSF